MTHSRESKPSISVRICFSVCSCSELLPVKAPEPQVFLDDRVASEVLTDQVLGVDAHGDHFHFTFDDQPA